MTNKVHHHWPVLDGGNPRRGSELGSAALVLLLFFEVACVMVGAQTAFFACVVLAWLLLAALVGYRSVLDAGCLFMLVSLGIVVVVDLAGHARMPLLT